MKFLLLARSYNEDTVNEGGYKMLQQTYYILVMGETSIKWNQELDYYPTEEEIEKFIIQHQGTSAKVETRYKYLISNNN